MKGMKSQKNNLADTFFSLPLQISSSLIELNLLDYQLETPHMLEEQSTNLLTTFFLMTFSSAPVCSKTATTGECLNFICPLNKSELQIPGP